MIRKQWGMSDNVNIMGYLIWSPKNVYSPDYEWWWWFTTSGPFGVYLSPCQFHTAAPWAIWWCWTSTSYLPQAARAPIFRSDWAVNQVAWAVGVDPTQLNQGLANIQNVYILYEYFLMGLIGCMDLCTWTSMMWYDTMYIVLIDWIIIYLI